MHESTASPRVTTPEPGEPLVDPARLAHADVHAAPFHFLVARNQLPECAAAALAADFPAYPSAGFFPYDKDDCGPSIVAVVEALTSPAFASALGAMIDMPGLADHPALVTICRSLNLRHGTIHTDSRSKIATALLYLCPDWPNGSAGALRFLSRIDSIDALVAPEVPPLYGTIAAFKRADNSFHGHLPFAGERPVIQVAWLSSQADLERKSRRGSFSRWLKKLLGGLDARWGATRSRDASHPD
jgi:hypothetical protein